MRHSSFLTRLGAITMTCTMAWGATPAAGDEQRVGTVDRPGAWAGQNSLYVGNRAPLAPSPLVKLPIGAIRPEGWLRRQLELQAAGFHGHLGEISRFLKKENNAWLSPSGEGEAFWEELPYWLKGFGDCGYVLGDERVTREAIDSSADSATPGRSPVGGNGEVKRAIRPARSLSMSSLAPDGESEPVHGE